MHLHTRLALKGASAELGRLSAEMSIAVNREDSTAVQKINEEIARICEAVAYHRETK